MIKVFAYLVVCPTVFPCYNHTPSKVITRHSIFISMFRCAWVCVCISFGVENFWLQSELSAATRNETKRVQISVCDVVQRTCLNSMCNLWRLFLAFFPPFPVNFTLIDVSLVFFVSQKSLLFTFHHDIANFFSLPELFCRRQFSIEVEFYFFQRKKWRCPFYCKFRISYMSNGLKMWIKYRL